jgi:hypothetical protein
MSLIPEECPPRRHVVDKAFVDADRHYTQLRRAQGCKVTATEFFTDHKNDPGVYWYFGQSPTYKHSPIPQLMDSTRGSAASNSTTSTRPPSTPVGSIYDARASFTSNGSWGSFAPETGYKGHFNPTLAPAVVFADFSGNSMMDVDAPDNSTIAIARDQRFAGPALANGFPTFNDQSGSYTQDADHQMDDLPEGYDYKEFIQVSARLLS